MLKNPKYVYGNCDRQILVSLHFGEYMLKKMWENRDVVCLLNGLTGEQLTYKEITQDAMNLAVSLARMGVKRGEVIAICSENRMEYWSTIIGILCTGAIVTTISTAYSKDEIEHVMGISKPKYIFCSPLTYKNHAKYFKYVEKIILYGDESESNTLSYNDIAVASNVKNTVNSNGIKDNVKYEDFLCAEVKGQTDTAFILYSSGTTGLPKGVMLSHVTVMASCTPLPTSISSTVLSVAPWYHSMGLMGSLKNFASGCTLVYLPRFEVDLYLKTIEKHKIPVLSLVPPVLVALSKSKIQYDTSSVLVIYSGAAPLYEETAKLVKNIFPNVASVLQGYGLSETTHAVAVNDNTDKTGSVGTAYENCILKVVNPETKEVLGPNEEGEICVKGITVMQGYVGKDRRLDFDDEGFFRTGDLGYYDDDKYFYIVDRLKELIKYKGYQVPPAEIEAVLLKHSGIRDVGVVGVPDIEAGELPMAFVALQPGVELTEKEIQDYVAERLSNPKRLRGGVKFLPEIPKNQTGKILRKELRKLVKTPRSKI